jgi:predicted Zn-dependent protease
MKRLCASILALLGLVMATAVPAQADIVLVTRAAIFLGDNAVYTGQPQPATYGWHWNETVEVYDATIQPNNWKITEAVAEWAKGNGLNAVMTTDLSVANIVVNEQFDPCGVTDPFSVVLGCAHLPEVSNGIAYGTATVNLNPSYKTEGLAEHVGSHELGHLFGLAHFYGNARSIMKPSVGFNTYLTRPTTVDYRDMRAAYGR